MVQPVYSLEAEDEPLVHPGSAAQQPAGVRRQTLYRLKKFHIFCIIVQRMIGTGIFSTSTTVLDLTHNIGASLMFWTFGAIVTLCVTTVYLDYASAIPQVLYGQGATRGRRHLPMNGGELIYLTHAFPRLRFIVSCIFGVIFVLLGNAAANCISFAIHFLELCGHTVGPGEHQMAVAGVAIAASTLVCFMHATWRKWGIRLNNFFAVIKLLMLVFVIFLGFISTSSFSTRGQNLRPETVFRSTKPTTNWESYPLGLLHVVFAYGGWNQGNYVFGEVGISPRAFRWTVLSAVFSISVLYILVNVAYAWVIEWPAVDNPDEVIYEFLANTLGKDRPGLDTKRLVDFMMAFSSFGNIIVTTFTSARVKQEVAKEGIFFYEKSIHIVRSWSPFDRLFNYMARRRGVVVPVANEEHHASHGSMAQAPTPALILHCVFSIALILLASVTSPDKAYNVIVGIYTLLVDTCIPVILAIALIHLRRTRGPNDLEFPRTPVPRWASIPCALLVIVAYSYIFLMLWVPHWTPSGVSSFVVPVAAIVVLAIGTLYWFSHFVYGQFQQGNNTFRAERKPIVLARDGRLTLVRDQVRLQWETPRIQREMAESELRVSRMSSGLLR